MKQLGKCLVGDLVRIDNYTSGWVSVKLHPIIFYRRFDEFQEGFKKVKGLYAQMDCDEFIIIRFSEKDDLTLFHKIHNKYL